MTLNFNLKRDEVYDSVFGRTCVRIPIINNSNLLNLTTAGCLVFDGSNKKLYINDNGIVTSIGDNTNPYTLPPSLQSIADLITTPNQMLYTIAADTYNTSPISGAGRSFVSALTQGDQQAAIGLVPGIDVQPYSTILDNLVTFGSTTNNILYTTGAGYATSAITPFVRSSILPLTSVNDLNTLTNAITGTVSTLNSLIKVNGANTVTETGITVDGSNNISGVVNLNVSGNIANSGGNLTIEGVSIPDANWSFVSSLNQNVGIGANNVNFTSFLTTFSMNNNKITSLAIPTVGSDAANKTYVDNAIAGAGQTFGPVVAATTGILIVTSEAGSGIGKTVQGTAANLSTIDDVALNLGDRVLVKDGTSINGTPSNGIYEVTLTGVTWEYTRATDADESSELVNGKTIIVLGGTVQSGTQWITSSPISPPVVDTDDIVFTQVGLFVAGNGIDIAGNIISVDAQNTFLNNPISLTNALSGATVANTLVAVNPGNTALVSTPLLSTTGNATSVVTEQGTQSLTNKTITSSTNDVAARSLFSNSGTNTVSVYSSPNPVAGSVLTAIDPNNASWQVPIASGFTPDRTLFVYPSATTPPNYSTLNDAITAASALTPTAANPVMIQIFPGTYYENVPINIPQNVTITGLTGSQSSVIIRPANNPATGLTMLICPGNVRLFGFLVDGSTAGGPGTGNAAVGILSSVGVVQGLDLCDAVTVRNTTDAGFRVSGNTISQFSKILLCRNCSVQITQPGLTMTTGVDVILGAILSGNNMTISGFFVLGFAGVITNGLFVRNNFSWADLNLLQTNYCVNGVVVGTGVTSNSIGDYPLYRCVGTTLGRVSQYGLWMREKSNAKISDFKVEDNTGQYPNQIHLQIDSPALPANPNSISTLWANLRYDLVSFGGPGVVTNPPNITGSNLSEVPGEIQSKFSGEVTVGFPANGYDFTAGEGDSHTRGMRVLLDDGGIFTEITTNVRDNTVNPIFTNIATTTTINLASAPPTIDGVIPVIGVSRVLVKNGSTANPVVPSVDNGIYIWNGAGVAMTRTSDFAINDTFTDQTYFVVDQGVINYHSEWKLNGVDSVGNPTDRFVIGTNRISMQSYSAAGFGSPLINNDAIYIGSQLFGKYPGVKLILSAPLTTTSGDSTTVLTWEYWNGGAWVHLPLMSTYVNPPYYNRSNITWGYGDTFVSDQLSYNYRFGDIDSTWVTTTVNGLFGYWIRCRITNSANIIQIPIIVQIKLQTNRSEINSDGYIEYFGNARSKYLFHLPVGSLTDTGTAGEIAPTLFRMVLTSGGTAGTIASNQPNGLWADAVTTSASFSYDPPINIDSSHLLYVNIHMSRSQSGAPGNTAWRVDYTFIGANNIVGNPNGSISQVKQGTSGIVLIPVSTTARGEFHGALPINIENLNTGTDVIWIKLSRLAGNAADTYNSDVYMHTIDLEYVIWCNGQHKNA